MGRLLKAMGHKGEALARFIAERSAETQTRYVVGGALALRAHGVTLRETKVRQFLLCATPIFEL